MSLLWTFLDLHFRALLLERLRILHIRSFKV